MLDPLEIAEATHDLHRGHQDGGEIFLAILGGCVVLVVSIAYLVLWVRDTAVWFGGG